MKKIVVPKVIAFEEYKSSDWNKYLEDKEFLDEGKRFKIEDVFLRGANLYM